MSTPVRSQLHIVLYRGFPVSNSYVWSPFVTKLEARLRFAELRFRIDQGSMSKSPRGKIPYIEITQTNQDQPTVLSDTSLIIQRLVDDDVCPDLNEPLSPIARAQDAAIRALLEDKLAFYQVSADGCLSYSQHTHKYSITELGEMARQLRNHAIRCNGCDPMANKESYWSPCLSWCHSDPLRPRHWPFL